VEIDKSHLFVALPANPMRRIERFIYDLAWGIAHGIFPPSFELSNIGSSYDYWKVGQGDTLELSHYLETVWEKHTPPLVMLIALDFMKPAFTSQSFTLTDKAYHLLETRPKAPRIFISYRHKESTALALLVEARLKLAGDADVFLDKNILGGEEWEALLKKRIFECEYMVCLVGRTAFEPKSWMLKEIDLAKSWDKIIIPVMHNSQTLGDLPPEINRQGIEILAEIPIEYEKGVNFVLNAVGYATY
jgi:hypothetical protein